jgi:hypothetical protein
MTQSQIDYEYQEYNDANENSRERESPPLPVILDDFLPKDKDRNVERLPDGSNKVEYSDHYSYDDEYSMKDNNGKKVAPVDIFDPEDDDRESSASFLEYFTPVDDAEQDHRMRFLESTTSHVLPPKPFDYDFQGFNNFRPIPNKIQHTPHYQPQGSHEKRRFPQKMKVKNDRYRLGPEMKKAMRQKHWNDNKDHMLSKQKNKVTNYKMKPKDSRLQPHGKGSRHHNKFQNMSKSRYKHRNLNYQQNRNRQLPRFPTKNSNQSPLQAKYKKQFGNNNNFYKKSKSVAFDKTKNNAFNRVNDRINHLKTQTRKSYKKHPVNTDIKAIILNEGDRGERENDRGDPFSKMKVKDHYFSSGPDVSDYFKKTAKPVFVPPPSPHQASSLDHQPRIKQQESKKQQDLPNVSFSYEEEIAKNPLKINPFRISLFPKFIDPLENGEEFTTPEYTTVRTPLETSSRNVAPLLEPPVDYGNRVHFSINNNSVVTTQRPTVVIGPLLPPNEGQYDLTLIKTRPIPPPREVFVVRQKEEFTTRRSTDVVEVYPPIAKKGSSVNYSSPDPRDQVIVEDAPSPFKNFRFNIREHEGLNVTTITPFVELAPNITAEVTYIKKSTKQSQRKPKNLIPKEKVVKWKVMKPLPKHRLKTYEFPRTKKDSIVYPKVAETSDYKEPDKDAKDPRPYRSNKSHAQDLEDNDNYYPHQYNIEIRKRFKGPVEYAKEKDKDKNHVREGREKHIDKELETNKYRNTEHKEEEHWHEKKWRKEDMKEEYIDGKPVKGLKVQVAPKYKAVESKEEKEARLNSNIPYYAQQLDPESTKVEIEQHFAIPSPGFRVDKTFESWVKKEIPIKGKDDSHPVYVSKGSRRDKKKLHSNENKRGTIADNKS